MAQSGVAFGPPHKKHARSHHIHELNYGAFLDMQAGRDQAVRMMLVAIDEKDRAIAERDAAIRALASVGGSPP